MQRRELGRHQVQAANKKASSCWKRSRGERIGEAHLLVLEPCQPSPQSRSSLQQRAMEEGTAHSFKMHVAASC